MKQLYQRLALSLLGLVMLMAGVWIIFHTTASEFFLGAVPSLVGLMLIIVSGPNLSDDIRHAWVFHRAFGFLPPRDKGEWKEYQLLAPAVLGSLKHLVNGLKDSFVEEKKIIASTSKPDFSPTIVEVIEARKKLGKTSTAVEREKRWLRKAQNAAQHFGFKVPDDMNDILKLDRLE